MSRLRSGILANLGARVAAALLLLLTLPWFMHLLGPEQYGLVVLFSSGISILSSFDFGLSTTLNREIAAASRSAERQPEIVQLALTLEAVFWSAAGALALAGVVLAPAVARHWLRLDHAAAEAAITPLRLMAVAVALQFPFTLYAGGLLGQQRLATLSAVLTATALARTLGTALALLGWGATSATYFWCQLAVGAAQALSARGLFWSRLPHGGRGPRFDPEQIRRVGRFSGAMTLISASGVLLTHLDKILLSRLLPLRELGYYGVAATAAASMGVMVAPVFNAMFPRLTQAVADGADAEAARLYHRASQFLAVLIWPPTCLLALHSGTILRLWTHDAELAAAAGPVLVLLVCGGAFSGIMHLPYAMQLAHGWTSLTLRLNLAALLILAPALYLGTSLLGLRGAALAWPLLNLGCFFAGTVAMHRRLLAGQLRRWYLLDLGLPLAASLAACLLTMLAWPAVADDIRGLAWLALSYLLALAAAAAAAPQLRSALASMLGKPIPK
jgi:O-antigen/teichoic acid export membrane protein